MLVVLLRGVNLGLWSHLGCSGQNTIICSREGLLYGIRAKKYQNMYSICFKYGLFLGPKEPGPCPNWSPLGV